MRKLMTVLFVAGAVVACGGDGTKVSTGEVASATLNADGKLCSNTCRYAGDGTCDDCGSGSDYSICAIGTDCGDCGPRDRNAQCKASSPGDDGPSHPSPSPSTSSGCGRVVHFRCQGCSGTAECHGSGCGSCQSLCREACEDNPHCGGMVSCY
ncbi:MAG: hypothetical protein FJ087_11235 [Deltaproteobacteria bacterium]|nr:hypothetical protein [Deltaproteobacteria bacterium]